MNTTIDIPKKVELFLCDCGKKALHPQCKFNTDIGDDYPCRETFITYVPLSEIADLLEPGQEYVKLDSIKNLFYSGK